MGWLSFLDPILDPGKEDRQNALNFQQSAINAQSAQEAADRGRLQAFQNERLKFAKDMMNGGSGFEGQGTLPMAQGWLQDYYKYLRNAPDVTFNAQNTALQGGLNQAYNQASERMAARGRLGSGGYGSILGNIGIEGAKAMSGLAGDRITRQGEMLSKGTALSQSMLDKTLNMQQSAYGMPQIQGTQVPQMMAGMSNLYTNQANAANANSPWAGLASAYVTNQMQRRTDDNNFANTEASPADGGQFGGGTSPWYASLIPGQAKQMAMNMQIPQGGGLGQQLFGMGVKYLGSLI